MKVGDLVMWNIENHKSIGIFIGTLYGVEGVTIPVDAHAKIARVLSEGKIKWVAISKLWVVE